MKGTSFFRIFIMPALFLLLSCANSKVGSTNSLELHDCRYYVDHAISEESGVPDFKLPELLIAANGDTITDSLAWMQIRRPEIMVLFTSKIYGRVPEWKGKVEYITTKENVPVMEGSAFIKEVTAVITRYEDTVKMNILFILPQNGMERHPVFLGLNFFGNHTVYPDTHITLADGYVINKPAIGVNNHHSTEAVRGIMKERWQVEKLIDKGFGLVTVFCGDIDPDFDDGFQNGIHPLFYKDGQHRPKDDEWGSISAWAWGLSRVMDYFEIEAQINENQVAVIGHSRLGKTALWTGASDPRFAIVISNNSGSGGAALYRRQFGETIGASLACSAYWYCKNFRKYLGQEQMLPVDQHMLIALMAPRPVYIASAAEDLWADPKGEFLSALYASPVYTLFNKQGIEVDEMPGLNAPLSTSIGYHIRSGGHNMTAYDWDQYITFASHNFAAE